MKTEKQLIGDVTIQCHFPWHQRLKLLLPSRTVTLHLPSAKIEYLKVKFRTKRFAASYFSSISWIIFLNSARIVTRSGPGRSVKSLT